VRDPHAAEVVEAAQARGEVAAKDALAREALASGVPDASARAAVRWGRGDRLGLGPGLVLAVAAVGCEDCQRPGRAAAAAGPAVAAGCEDCRRPSRAAVAADPAVAAGCEDCQRPSRAAVAADPAVAAGCEDYCQRPGRAAAAAGPGVAVGCGDCHQPNPGAVEVGPAPAAAGPGAVAAPVPAAVAVRHVGRDGPAPQRWRCRPASPTRPWSNKAIATKRAQDDSHRICSSVSPCRSMVCEAATVVQSERLLASAPQLNDGIFRTFIRWNQAAGRARP
jgi:hypothetical protein